MWIDSPRRRQHLEEVAKRMPEHVERLYWSEERLNEERQKKLRETLAFTREKSAWHRDRMAGIDIENFTVDDITSLPTMNKNDVMANWDQIVTDPRLTLELANANIVGKLRGEITDYYLFDEYQIFATGGSSGHRGVFVWGWEEFIEFACVTYRYQMRDRPPEHFQGRRCFAVVEAGEMVHASPFLFAVSTDPGEEIVFVPADTPTKDLVAQLNDIQPTHIVGYSSAIELLAGEALAGNLHIKPEHLGTNSEPLMPQARKAAQEAWGININNAWGSVEVGVLGVECDHYNGMHLTTDNYIIEFVDKNNEATEDPDKIDKLLVTSFICRSLPMIRYELTDIAIPKKERCSSGAIYPLISEIRGRSDDAFKYDGDVSIHPMVFRTPLGQDPAIEQYQVRQTERGADVGVIARDKVDLDRLRADIEDALQSRGLDNPKVTIRVVEQLEHHKETGKMKRFIPLQH